MSSAIILVVTDRSSKKKRRNGWNLVELNECLLAVGSRKKKWFSFLSPLSYESLRKAPIEKQRKKEERKTNAGTTQTRLNAPHVRYNVKILPQ